MGKLKVSGFTVSIDGYGAGVRQSAPPAPPFADLVPFPPPHAPAEVANSAPAIIRRRAVSFFTMSAASRPMNG